MERMNASQAVGRAILPVMLVVLGACCSAEPEQDAKVHHAGNGTSPAAAPFRAIDCSPSALMLEIEVFQGAPGEGYRARLTEKDGELCVTGNLKEVVWRAHSHLAPSIEVAITAVTWQPGSCLRGARENRKRTLDVAPDSGDPLTWRGVRSRTAAPTPGDCWRYDAEVEVIDESGAQRIAVDPEIIWRD
jgi:hypothetical protein